MARGKRQVQFWRSAAKQPAAFQGRVTRWTATTFDTWPAPYRTKFRAAYRAYIQSNPAAGSAERSQFATEWIKRQGRPAGVKGTPSLRDLASLLDELTIPRAPTADSKPKSPPGSQHVHQPVSAGRLGARASWVGVDIVVTWKAVAELDDLTLQKVASFGSLSLTPERVKASREKFIFRDASAAVTSISFTLTARGLAGSLTVDVEGERGAG